MDKIHVEIFIPMIMKTYEAYIPVRSKVYEILQLIEGAIYELSDGSFRPDETIILCERNTGVIYNMNMSIYQLNLKNGTQLMLI